MKLTQDLHIISKTKTEKENVIRVLKENGFNPYDKDDHYLCINVDCVDNDYMTCIDSDIWFGSAVLTYTQFMEKYSNKENVMNKRLMISRINAAKEKLNLGDSELSVKLGHNRNYISRVLHQENPSVEQMTKVVKKCNDLILTHYSEELKEEDSLNQKLPCGKPLPEFKHTPVVDAVMVSKNEYYSLKKELDHKNQVLDKRNDLYRKLELECKDKDDAIKLQLENVASKILAINELELQLKTTQQKFVDVVDQKDSEIKKLQNDCNHATNQYQGKRAQVVQLNEKLNKQAIIYLIIIVIISLVGIMGFVS